MCYCKNLSGLQLKARRESGQSRERCPERTGPQREEPARSAGRTRPTSGFAGFLTTLVKHKASGGLHHEVLVTQNNLKEVDASYSEDVTHAQKPAAAERAVKEKRFTTAPKHTQHPGQVPQENARPSHRTPQRNTHESRDAQRVLPGKRLAAVDAGALPPRAPSPCSGCEHRQAEFQQLTRVLERPRIQPGSRDREGPPCAHTHALVLTHSHTLTPTCTLTLTHSHASWLLTR